MEGINDWNTAMSFLSSSSMYSATLPRALEKFGR